jgi:hypothetical protein
MKTPGFSAERSLSSKARGYAAAGAPGHAGREGRVLAQLESECCDISCPGRCICFQGHGTCEVVMKGGQRH